jgi:hypothetical protein
MPSPSLSGRPSGATQVVVVTTCTSTVARRPSAEDRTPATATRQETPVTRCPRLPAAPGGQSGAAPAAAPAVASAKAAPAAPVRTVTAYLRSSADGRRATVDVHVVTTTTWVAPDGRPDSEGDGIDHAIVLVRRGDRWLVAADRYTSDLTPRLLQAAGAPRATVAGAARRLETAAARGTQTAAPPSLTVGATPAGVAPGYVAKLTYDRAAAKAYADRYALPYNPTYVSFSADCANFGSQVMYAGGYPQFGTTYASGWWYDKSGTSSPADDTYSHAWIAVANQQAAWNTRYTDVVSSISDVGVGDFVYYDWTGNGTWDHVAELVGTNTAGQKVVDAHTTDHSHVYWKMGTTATHYRFVRTLPSIVI